MPGRGGAGGGDCGGGSGVAEDMREETRVISGERQSGVVSPAASASSATSCLPARGAAITAGPPLPSPAAVAAPPVGPPSKDGLHVVLVERPPRTVDVAPIHLMLK